MKNKMKTIEILKLILSILIVYITYEIYILIEPEPLQVLAFIFYMFIIVGLFGAYLFVMKTIYLNLKNVTKYMKKRGKNV